MNNRCIKWEKFRNPLIPLSNSNEEESGRVMVRSTPFGVEGLQYNPDFPSEKVYIAHTNFDIDKDVKNITENTEGVEVLEIYGPYRMRITIGKAFNSKRVRRLIRDNLCKNNKSYKFTDDTSINLYKETLKLKNQKNPWAVFVLPNGSYESKIFQDEKDAENTLPYWESVRQRIGGIILTY